MAEEQTPEEVIRRLKKINEEVEFALDENKVVLLNVYSVLVKELRTEAAELASQLKKDPTEVFTRKTVYEHLQQVEICENNVFQLSNSLKHNNKKIDLLVNQLT